MEIARVDLRGVVPGGLGWEAARAAATASMVAHGCVVVAHDPLGEDLRRSLFGRAMPELFALPVEAKKLTVSTKVKYRGYWQFPGSAIESLRAEDPTNADSIRSFAELLWPEGNAEFCETIMSFTNKMLKLEEMVETLVLEGLGARGKSVGAHLDLLMNGVRLTHYGAPPDTETCMSMKAHYDDTMTSMIIQHEVEGLEVRVGDGRWVAVPPEPDTFTCMAGEQFRVLTNGRVPACFHRVRTPSNRERFVVLFSRRQKDGAVVRTLDDLIDAEHPLLYSPLRHEEYTKWRLSEEGLKVKDTLDTLKAFCGVDKVGANAML